MAVPDWLKEGGVPPPPGWAERVAGDPWLRQHLQAARAWGVSLSVFLGDKQIIIHEHNDAGQVVRSTTSGWTSDDRDAALALQAWEADLCPGCRQPLAETTKAEHEDMYVSSPPIRCHRCTASEQAAERYQNTPQSSALLIPVALRDPI